VLVTGLVAGLGLLVCDQLGTALRRSVVVLALVAALAGPAAYSAQTVASARTGSMPTAGPAVSGDTGGFGGARAGGPGDGTPPSGGFDGTAPRQGTRPTQGTGGGGSAGGTASSDLVALLEDDAGRYRWVAATTGSQSAATYQLATEDPVMAIGGFTGSDDSPTLEQFQAYVAAGAIHYYISGGGMGGRGGGDGVAAQIAEWVAANYTAQTVGDVTVYDLTT
jgi:hypothetical protein